MLLKVSDGNKVIVLYTDDDLGLSLETLRTGFPRAVNLVNTAYATDTVLLRIHNGKIYNPDGWNPNIVYLVYDGTQTSALIAGDSEKLGKFERFLFYSRILLKNTNGSIEEDKDLKYACVPFYTTLIPRRYFVISTRHGSHQCLEIGDELKIYNRNHEPFDVKVISYNDNSDFIIFESAIELCENMPIPGPINGGARYVMLGFAEIKQCKNDDDHISPCYASGLIISSQPNTAGHVCGSSGGVAGMSGGPVFDLDDNRLIGICVSTDDLDDRETSFGRFSSDTINYCKEITIVRIMPVHMAAILLSSTIEPCDGVDMTTRIKEMKFHCILFHNISYYAGGTTPWGSDANDAQKQSSCDGKIEVLGFTTATLAALQMGGKGERIAQCSSVKIITSKAIPMQVDGEPCLLAPSFINLSFHSKVPMLFILVHR